MSEQEMLEQLTTKLERLEAVQACRNLMGKYSYYHTAFRNNEYIDLWAKRDDDLLVMPWGSYKGFEGVKACYLKDHGDRNDPGMLDSLRGAVMMHEMDTEVIEVAKDGKTPKDTRTGCQKKALEKYVKDFHRRFPDVRIVGHNELAAKACPSFDVQKWLKEIGINQ